MEQRTEEFYKELIKKLMEELKNDFINEGYDEEIPKLIRAVIIFL